MKRPLWVKLVGVLVEPFGREMILLVYRKRLRQLPTPRGGDPGYLLAEHPRGWRIVKKGVASGGRMSQLEWFAYREGMIG